MTEKSTSRVKVRSGSAMVFLTALIGSGSGYAQAPTPADQVPTPRGADGHPILTGVWNAPAPGAAGGTILNVDCNSGTNREKCQTSDSIDFIARGGTFQNFEED